MPTQNPGIVKLILSILLFPTFFQEAFIGFAWGAADPAMLQIAKRVLLLLPVLAFVLACWITVASVLTILVRPNRREFVTDLFVTWWDLGKSVLAFWSGILTFLFRLLVVSANTVKIIVMAVWSLLQELLAIPFRLFANAGKAVVRSPIPWIAVSLTLFWCFIESMIFTYVTTPLVVDTFSNITGDALSANFIRIPLFIFLLFVVLGSYAVLSTMVDAFQKKNIYGIMGIVVIEIVVLFVEVIFLYREFVDSLVPWFAQYSENFELGIWGTLAISSFVWFGIRSLSWFLFAAHGTPTILRVIQGRGLDLATPNTAPHAQTPTISTAFTNRIKADMAWVQQAGETLAMAFMQPPLQILAASINFCTLLISSEHLFELPLKDLDVLKRLRVMNHKAGHKTTPANETEHHLGELPNVKFQ